MMTLCCGECGCELASWEPVYSWGNGMETEYVCEDCFDSLFLALTREEKANLIHSSVTTAEDRLYGA